jgi:hypothetical protein
MTDRSPASLVEEMCRYIRKKVAGGFLDAKEVEEMACDCFLDGVGDDGQLDPALLRRIAGVETDKAFAEHLAAQQEWPAVTDCDRLDRAFADLDHAGIVARQNFTCCHTCGHAEIGDEIAQAERSGTSAIGYTFYHCQTTDGAVETGNVYLYYGAEVPDAEVDQYGPASLRVGRAVVEALERRGLAVDWNGSLDTAIRVKLKWQRRITRQMAERGPSH